MAISPDDFPTGFEVYLESRIEGFESCEDSMT